MTTIAKQLLSESGDKTVILVKDGEWSKILKDKNVKSASMIGGRDGADYEITYKDNTSKLFKFA